MILTLN